MDSLIKCSVDIAKMGTMAIILYGDITAQIIDRKVVQRDSSMVSHYQPKPIGVDVVMSSA